ncbi:MAG: transcriptional regulator [Planctomycetia bacterium]|nr:transcriptional regulator [Planctomycetia bacterium]
MEIREVALDDLVLDPNLYLRDRLDDFTVERYADSWDRLPPVTVYDVDGSLVLADGYHRHAAAVMLGRKALPAEVRQGSFTDALDFVSEINLFHGLPLTRAERRRAVEVKLKLHHDWSDRRMAEELGVNRDLVAKTRKSLVEGHQIPNNAGRVGADGKMYTTAGLPRDPNERLPKDKSVAQDDPRDRGSRESDAPPWDDTSSSPSPAGSASLVSSIAPPWETPDARTVALSDPVPSAAPTIDEMLSLMARRSPP